MEFACSLLYLHCFKSGKTQDLVVFLVVFFLSKLTISMSPAWWLLGLSPSLNTSASVAEAFNQWCCVHQPLEIQIIIVQQTSLLQSVQVEIHTDLSKVRSRSSPATYWHEQLRTKNDVTFFRRVDRLLSLRTWTFQWKYRPFWKTNVQNGWV